MDTSSFFNYPTVPQTPAVEREPGLLAGRTEDDWAILLRHSETLRFRPGEVVLRAGEIDRALYILTEGHLEIMAEGGSPRPPVTAPATVGEASFLDGRPRAVTLRALSGGELLRLSFEAYEALAAWDHALGRALLLDVGRILASRLRAASAHVTDWTG